MRYSVQLPTCTEGLVNPIPFAAPADFVRLARQLNDVNARLDAITDQLEEIQDALKER